MYRYRHGIWALGLALCLLLAPPSFGQAGLSAPEIFAMADQAKAANHPEDALIYYEALERDPSPDIRAEARFRKGMLLNQLGRRAEAASAFRALLDEKPDSVGVRLELARVLASLGRDQEAARALRQAQASSLPPEVALVVDQFANALRSQQRFGGSVELAIAPDSNVNRATDSRTLDTIIAPLTLSDEARATSGTGLRAAGQVYGRLGLRPSLALLPRLSVSDSLYRDRAFDDLSASALIGVEWRGHRTRLTPSVGQTWRWYGQQPYARTTVGSLDLTRSYGARTQLTANVTAGSTRYITNDLQNGELYDVTVAVEHALSARSGAGANVSVTRQTAADAGYATWAEGVGLFGWREHGRGTFYLSGGVRRLDGDARLFLFTDRRREWLYSLTGTATLRQFTFHTFAPLIRISWERNRSTVGIYDYRRLSGEIGVARAF